jgi:hypothetical protein
MKAAWLIGGLIFGVIPTNLIFIWASLNCVAVNPLDLFTQTLQPPQHPFSLYSTVYDVILFLMWGFCHSFFAQSSFQNFCQQKLRIPAYAMRMVFYIGNGITTVLLISLWKSTGIAIEKKLRIVRWSSLDGPYYALSKQFDSICSFVLDDFLAKHCAFDERIRIF